MNPGLLLHARSRGLYPAVAVLSAIAVPVPLGIRALSHHAPGAVESIRFNLLVMTIAAGVAVVAQGLAGADPELEGSVPRIGPRFRFVHLLFALLAVVGSLTLAVPLLPATGDLDFTRSDQVWIVLRDSAGLLGLATLTSAVAGARFGWAPVTVWVLALSFTTLPRSGWRQVAAMPKTQPDVTIAALVAVGLLVVGVAAYSFRRLSR